ncbi:hypothetical protein [Nocardiopsis deserti]|uniref:hypothetical protein n=1 Tax=Nocardiopsis deserti TaxID=2605988 RepID=UPI0012396614|nr:hypothetical protein [Nocardiopsis deserti]
MFVADPEIRAQHACLDKTRVALGRMCEDAVNIPTVQDSSEDADYTFTNRQLVRYRERCAEALVDLPDVPLFLGCLDYPEARSSTPCPRHRWNTPCPRPAGVDLGGGSPGFPPTPVLRRRFYVAFTRAVSRLHVVHSAALPAALDGAAR